MKVPSTKVQNNFGKYLKYAEVNEEIIVTRKGKDVARLLPCETLNEEAVEYKSSGNRVSYEEFLELVENSEQRFELIDGIVYNMASPSHRHQHAIYEIIGTFYNWFKGKTCKPLTSPFDITFFKAKNNTCVVQPDILVMCDPENINKDDKYMGVPTLVIEVLSPSTRGKDMLKKLDLYMTCGVKEYWIVDPKAEHISIYLFKDNSISENMVYKKSAEEYAESIHFQGLKVYLPDVFL
jgi:prevent-host-death family protein